MAPTGGPGPGGRRFLPLPILASVLFIVLAIGSQMQGTAHTQYGDFPTVAGLLLTRPTADESSYGIAYDRVASVSRSGDYLELRFASCPGQAFSVYYPPSHDDVTAGTPIYALFVYGYDTDHSWHLFYILVP